MLELRSPDAAFERIEAWLRERGFFAPGGEDLVADLYLGYGLSEPLRRTGAPAPPEPCPALPVAALAVRGTTGSDPGHVRIGHRGTTRSPEARASLSLTNTPARDTTGSDPAHVRIGRWERSWTDAEYAHAVDEVRGAIARGDVYQVNLVQHLAADFEGDPHALTRALAPFSPRVLQGDGWAIVSASPPKSALRCWTRLTW